MKNQTVQELNKLNQDFYAAVAEEFSQTRNYLWPGWNRVGEYLFNTYKNAQTPLSILDVGCGNGRFNTVLLKIFTTKIAYTGIDANDKLLTDAKTKYPNDVFSRLDVVNDPDKIKQQFDVVTAFGVTHHIPSAEFRRKWFLQLTDLVKPNGSLIISFWNFDITHTVSYEKITDIEKNDYFLSWNKNTNIHRYCHFFDEEEKNDIIKVILENNFRLVEKFESDGKTKKGNTYMIFAKI